MCLLCVWLHNRGAPDMQTTATARFIGLMFFSTVLYMEVVQPARILLLPYSVPSHMLYFASLGSELVQKGHTVHMVHSSEQKTPRAVTDAGIGVYLYNAAETESLDPPLEEALQFSRYMMQNNPNSVIQGRHQQDMLKPSCTNILQDEEVFTNLMKEGYDLAIVDGLMLIRCLYILPYRLRVPFISLITQYEPWLFRIPALPSFVPYALVSSYTEKMTFWQKLHNIYAQLDWHWSPGFFNADDSLVSRYAPDMPYVALSELARRSKLWLLNTDTAIDYARPTLPHVIPVGGLTTVDPKPLSGEFEAFIKDWEEGIVVVSFGTVVKVFPPEITQKLLDAFKLLKEKVIWKFRGELPENIPENVKLSHWIPQNDLLGYKGTKLFITHGGNNGQFEALNSGVPMVVLPIFSEQTYNGNRIQYKGYGVCLSMTDTTPEELYKNVRMVIDNPDYRHNIELGRSIFRSAPMSPRERAVFWIEHVLKYGDSHLRSWAVDMPWYQYWMLDLLGLILLMFFTIIAILYLITRKVISICSFKNYKLKHD